MARVEPRNGSGTETRLATRPCLLLVLGRSTNRACRQAEGYRNRRCGPTAALLASVRRPPAGRPAHRRDPAPRPRRRTPHRHGHHGLDRGPHAVALPARRRRAPPRRRPPHGRRPLGRRRPHPRRARPPKQPPRRRRKLRPELRPRAQPALHPTHPDGIAAGQRPKIGAACGNRTHDLRITSRHWVDFMGASLVHLRWSETSHRPGQSIEVQLCSSWWHTNWHTESGLAGFAVVPCRRQSKAVLSLAQSAAGLPGVWSPRLHR
jgi:hypothetical protein